MSLNWGSLMSLLIIALSCIFILGLIAPAWSIAWGACTTLTQQWDAMLSHPGHLMGGEWHPHGSSSGYADSCWGPCLQSLGHTCVHTWYRLPPPGGDMACASQGGVPSVCTRHSTRLWLHWAPHGGMAPPLWQQLSPCRHHGTAMGALAYSPLAPSQAQQAYVAPAPPKCIQFSLPHSSRDKPGHLPALGTTLGEWHHPHGSSTGGTCPGSTPLRQPPLKGREGVDNAWTATGHLPGMGQGTGSSSLPSPAEPGSLPGALSRMRWGTHLPRWTCSIPQPATWLAPLICSTTPVGVIMLVRSIFPWRLSRVSTWPRTCSDWRPIVQSALIWFFSHPWTRFWETPPYI